MPSCEEVLVSITSDSLLCKNTLQTLDLLNARFLVLLFVFGVVLLLLRAGGWS
jgi:hypothetical protein